MSPKQKFSVFVSSTSEDLESYRAVARLVVLDMQWMPLMMEHWGALASPTVQTCYEKLEQADLMLLLVAFRRGWIPTTQEGGNGIDSITACELAFARSRNVPVLAMLANGRTWPGEFWEEDQAARAWVKKFRDELNLPAAFFDYEQEAAAAAGSEGLPIFRAKVRETLVSFRESLIAKEAAVIAPGNGLDYFESACEALGEGSSIPFVGTGVYGDGPLGEAALTKALSVEAAKDQACLATIAEYREQYLADRQRFLGRLRTVLNEQAKQLQRLPMIYEMLLKIKPPPLIVSATCDLVLERALETQGKSYVLVCHVVRSHNKEQDGKILVFRGQKPEFCVADKIDTRGADYVIYKPLGSPLLHDLLDPEMEIDTVVMTETDHLTLLGRLEHELTQIPTAFSRLLQRRSILFAGYALDVWQYRLVMQVFELVRFQGGRPSSIAVREPATPMETLAWSRLATDLIRIAPSDFAGRVLSTFAPGSGVCAYGD